MTPPSMRYPTPEHEAAAAEIVGHFSGTAGVDAVLLVNSCARGKATRDSCLDVVVLARPAVLRDRLGDWEARWALLNAESAPINVLRGVGRNSVVHLDFVDGVFAPSARDEVAGPDDFELRVGNHVAHAVPLWEGSGYFSELRQRWLPYYEDALRNARLVMVRGYCLGNLRAVAPSVERGLYFHAFDRLYNAYREFLQAVFIARRRYPLAYDKWIREQVVEILGMPELYSELPRLLEIGTLESGETVRRAERLRALLEQYAPAPAAG
jgi:hypothetical protein